MIVDASMVGWTMTIQDAFSNMVNYRNVPLGVAMSSTIFARGLMGVLRTSALQLRLMDRQRQPEPQQSDNECVSATESEESSSEDIFEQD